MKKKDELQEETKTADIKPVRLRVGRKKPARLVQLQGPGAPAVFRLEQDQVLVGRGEDADIRFNSGHVSRHHLLLKRAGPEFLCCDLESHNGVFLNEVKIHSAVLKPGDQIQLGDVVLRFEEEG